MSITCETEGVEIYYTTDGETYEEITGNGLRPPKTRILISSFIKRKRLGAEPFCTQLRALARAEGGAAVGRFFLIFVVDL